MKRVVKKMMMLSVALLLAGCDLLDPFNNNNNDSGKGRIVTPVVFTVAEEAVSEESYDFAFRFLEAVDSTMPDGTNYIVSPFSAQVALAMAMNGAADSTYLEVRDVLGYNGMDIDDINSYNKKLIDGLDCVAEDIRVDIANSLWVNNNIFLNSFTEVLPEYKFSMLENYDAEVQALDFSNPSTLNHINRWCSSHTNSLIEKAFDFINPYSVAILLNAVYFKAPWNEPFEKKYNTMGFFDSDSKGSQEVVYMNHNFDAKYYKNDKFEITAKAYGKSARYAFYIVLPRKGATTDECFEELSTDLWENRSFELVEVDMSIPKFKIENRTSLIPALKSMGISRAFTADADFSNLATGDSIHITDVSQSNIFMIDEKGAEGASATKVEIGYDSAPLPLKKVDFKVNRPFLFFVMENSTKTVLFAGKVSSIEL